MKTQPKNSRALLFIAAGVFAFSGFAAKSQAQTAGDVQVTIAELLDMDYDDIQKATNGGRDDIWITNLIPGYNITKNSSVGMTNMRLIIDVVERCC